MCPRGRPQGQGRPRGLHLCLLAPEILKYSIKPISSSISLRLVRYQLDQKIIVT